MADMESKRGSVTGGNVTKTTFSFTNTIENHSGRSTGATGHTIQKQDVIDFDIELGEIEEPEKYANAVGAKQVSGFMSLLSGIVNFVDEALSTAAVLATSVTSGVLDLVEHVVDGAAWVVSAAGSALGADTTGIKEFISRDLVDEANEWFYESTDLGKHINESSAVKYDSDFAQGVRHVTEEVAVYVAATAATVCTGGAGAVLVPLAAGFLYGSGKKAEDTYQTKGTDTTLADEICIGIAGVGEAVNWYAKGKLGKGATSLIKVASQNGWKATAAALGSRIKATFFNVKDNGLLKTLRGIFSREQLRATVGKSLLQSDNIRDSVGIIGDNLSRWINGDEEFNFKTASYAFGELILTWGANVVMDSATDYLGALNDVAGIRVETLDDAIEQAVRDGVDEDYVDEAALFGNNDGSEQKKGFLRKVFGGGSSSVPDIELTTRERILRDKINDQLKHGKFARITVNNTTEITTNVLRSVDNLDHVQVRINGGFNDLDGNYRPKYNGTRYVERITYTGYETLAITRRLDELTSQIDMTLPPKERAKQIYDILRTEVPARHDYELYPEHMKVFQSLRGLTDVNDLGQAGLICAGYSQAYKELCTRAGLTCDYIRGVAYHDMLRQGRAGGHAWNIVLMPDGSAIPVDVTWGTSGENWFGGSDAFQALHEANADEWFKDYSAPRSTHVKIADALSAHDAKYGAGTGLERLQRYLEDGNPTNITSSGGARQVITSMSREDLTSFVEGEKVRQVYDIMSTKYGSTEEALLRLKEYINPRSENYGNIRLFTSTGGAREMMVGISFKTIEEFVGGK